PDSSAAASVAASSDCRAVSRDVEASAAALACGGSVFCAPDSSAAGAAVSAVERGCSPGPFVLRARRRFRLGGLPPPAGAPSTEPPEQRAPATRPPAPFLPRA